MQITPLCLLALAGSAIASNQAPVEKREPQLPNFGNIASKIGDGAGAVGSAVAGGSGAIETIGSLLGPGASSKLSEATSVIGGGAGAVTSKIGEATSIASAIKSRVSEASSFVGGGAGVIPRN